MRNPPYRPPNRTPMRWAAGQVPGTLIVDGLEARIILSHEPEHHIRSVELRHGPDGYTLLVNHYDHARLAYLQQFDSDIDRSSHYATSSHSELLTGVTRVRLHRSPLSLGEYHPDDQITYYSEHEAVTEQGWPGAVEERLAAWIPDFEGRDRAPPDEVASDLGLDAVPRSEKQADDAGHPVVRTDGHMEA
jgi:hypothetical protein